MFDVLNKCKHFHRFYPNTDKTKNRKTFQFESKNIKLVLILLKFSLFLSFLIINFIFLKIYIVFFDQFNYVRNKIKNYGDQLNERYSQFIKYFTII